MWLISWRKRMSKLFLRCLRIWPLTIGFLCKLCERRRSSDGRGMGGGGLVFGTLSVGACRKSGGGGRDRGGWRPGGQGGSRPVGLAKAVEVRDLIGRKPGQGERFVYPLAGTKRSCVVIHFSSNRGAWVHRHRRLRGAGGGCPALWRSWVSLPVESVGGLERVAG